MGFHAVWVWGIGFEFWGLRFSFVGGIGLSCMLSKQNWDETDWIPRLLQLVG